ncbi:hypothetical protein F4782DRAFT_549714 [Xylaria castorea]|nr:hypothetical protein F4782DRAFT_549714 [Xylaria castorea]
MLGSFGFNLAYVLMSTTHNYCLHRLEVAMRELGVGPEDTIVRTFDATSILGTHTTNTASAIATDPTSSPAINSTSTSISTSTPTSTSISTSISVSTSTATSTSVSSSTVTTTSTTISTTVSTSTSATIYTSTITSTTYVVDSATTAIESSATIEPSVPEPARDIKSRRAADSKVAIKPQATLEFPVPSGLPASRFEPSDGFDWVSIYDHGKEQEHPFNLTSSMELEDLQWTTSELLGLRRELGDVAKAPFERRAQANGLGEVLTFVAITPLRNMSKIVMELQDRFVDYNANKPPGASGSIRMGPFIEDALERLRLTRPGNEGLSSSGRQAYQSLINFDKPDRRYCFHNNCHWRDRVLDKWRDVNQKRDFFTARLTEVNKQLLAKDEAEWQTVLWAIKTFGWLLPAYTVLLILGNLVAKGWPIYPKARNTDVLQQPTRRAVQPTRRAVPAGPQLLDVPL